MNLNGKLKKLQTALVKKGIIIKINTNQFYSEEQHRMITQYRVCEDNEELIKTCSMVEVIKCLLERYRQVVE